MKIKIGQICDFTKSTTVCKNFIKGRRILHAGHLFCGKQVENETSVTIIGFRLQTLIQTVLHTK